MNTKNIIIGILTAILLFVGIQSLVGKINQSDGVGGGSRYPSGLSADSTSPSTGEVRGTTFTSTGAATLGGSLSAGATSVEGFTQGGTATILTDVNGGTYTLTQAELVAAGTLEFTASGAGMEVIALTMPATSTMTTLIPNAGDCRTWLYDASGLAAATTTTMTAGTGHNIIAYTTDDDVIDGAEFSQIQMCRKNDGDVNTIVTELLHAD